MGIASLCHGKRQRRARVAHACPISDRLREVKVTKCRVREVVGEDARGERVLVPAEDLALALVGESCPNHVAVAHGDEGLAGRQATAALGENLGIDLAHAFHQRVHALFWFDHRKVGGTQEGYGGHPRTDAARPIGERGQDAVGIDGPSSSSRE